MSAAYKRHHPLRVAINAQVVPNMGSPGVNNVLIGLVRALGRLDDGPEQYVIIDHWQSTGWLETYIGPNQSIVRAPPPMLIPAWAPRPLNQALGLLRPVVHRMRRSQVPLLSVLRSQQQPKVPVSNGFYESLGCNVIHFPFQHFVVCALPSIFNPHDLQHLHYPEFFEASEIAVRETVYPTACHLACTVVAGSHWVKQDVVRHYHVDPDKVQVIPWAPSTQAYPAPSSVTLTAVEQKYRLHRPFALYPAATWEHKNHLRLLEGVAGLRDHGGMTLRVVCTGIRHPSFWPRIEERLRALDLAGQVQFLGMVPPDDLRAIYRLAQFVVVPTLFEAASGPVFEAWEEGTPVACSTVTSLPEQVSDAALLFDPLSVEAIVDALRRMAGDADLRAGLVRKGERRLQDFSWERTAKAYRAVYRQAARCPLTEEDRWLLSWDWMQEPQRKVAACL